MRPLMFETDTQFWYETLRVLGHASYEGADVAEALTTAERITPGDYDSWHEEWRATAERVEAEARQQLAAGHHVSAHDGLLRAATYFRSAEFFLRDEPVDPRGPATYERGVACFTNAAALMDPPVQPIRVPYEGTTLNGYLYRADESGEARPTLLIHTGFDGWAEEMHHTGALAAQQRGYTVIAFDGPGQPGPRWHDGLTFRPDWEAAVSPVVDFAIGLPEVDAERIALCGNSMGGELAPRAAAFEKRISALICVDGLYDFGASYTKPLGLGDAAAAALRAEVNEELDALLTKGMSANSMLRWSMRQGMWCFGVKSPRAFLAATLDYHLRDGIAEQIECPVLVAKAESDEFFAGQPEQLLEHLNGRSTMITFTDAEGAGSHCHIGAQRFYLARVLDWLDEQFSPGR